ncbi:hypothetical protein BASA81_018251 [Batrachochytrium salamandrivorans]|nr:hypothetical protein BASA81_018251 [Batrachochytrium salamandrivorans]
MVQTRRQAKVLPSAPKAVVPVPKPAPAADKKKVVKPKARPKTVAKPKETVNPPPPTAMDERVMAALRAAATSSDVTKTLLEHFPDKPFAVGGRVVNYWRKFVPWLLVNVSHAQVNEELFTLINKVYARDYPNHATLDSILTKDVRGVVAKRFKTGSKQHKMSKSLVKISYAEKAALIKGQSEKVLNKNSNRMQFDPEEIIQIIKDGVNSEDPMRQAVALLLCSGSRPVEFFERSTFTPAPEIGPSWVTQNYIAKSKTLAKLVKPIIYLTADQFIALVTEVRAKLRLQYPSFLQADGNLRSALLVRGGIVAKQMFQQREGFTLYTTRKVYGIVSFETFAKTTTIFGKNPGHHVWLNKVLGHNESSVETSNNYSHVSLASKEQAPEQVIINQIVLENKLENLEERFDQEHVPEPAEKPIKFKSDDRLILDKFRLINKVYEAYVEENEKVPTQTQLERLAKDKASRAIIREFYRLKKSGEY